VLLAQRFGASARSTLMLHLHDSSEVLRARVLEALGYLNDPASGDAVASLANDPAIRVRQNAALVLATIGDPRAPDAITKLISDPSTTHLIRPHILRGIGSSNRGDYATAVHELDLVLNDAPYAADALVLLADINGRQGHVEQARELLEEALRFNPSHKGARARLGIK